MSHLIYSTELVQNTDSFKKKNKQTLTVSAMFLMLKSNSSIIACCFEFNLFEWVIESFIQPVHSKQLIHSMAVMVLLWLCLEQFLVLLAEQKWTEWLAILHVKDKLLNINFMFIKLLYKSNNLI